MSTRTRRAAPAATFVVASLLALLAVIVGATDARAATFGQRVDVAMSFENLLPGQSAEQSTAVDLPVGVRVSAVRIALDGRQGAVRWAVRLCPTAGGACTAVEDARVGAVLAAGSYALVVGVTSVSLAPGEVSSLLGRVAFAEAGTGALAATGADGVAALSALAAAVLATGFLLLLVVRGRRRDTEPAGPPC